MPQEVKIRIDDAKEQSGKDIAPSLILVSGVAGKAWAKGADLGEQTGRVVVENVQVRFNNFIHIICHLLCVYDRLA